MPYFTYDTSVFISRSLTALSNFPRRFRMSAVVLMELGAGAVDESQRKSFAQMARQYQNDGSLIVPNEEDWFNASRILFLLSSDRRRAHQGKLKPLPVGASQRMALDVLIAVSARRRNAKVVTENWNDFKLIQRYCNAIVIKASDFFKP
jgi:predicted nucleic acid-binding protein